MAVQPPSAYAEVCKLLEKTATLASVGSLVSWDQETYMPPAAAGARAEQLSLLAGLVHQHKTSPKIGELLSALEADKALEEKGMSEVAANVREMRRDYDLATKLPESLVSELAKVGSQAQEVWKDARQKSDFPMFAP